MSTIVATLPSGKTKSYSSASAVSRELSGTGSDGLRNQVARVARAGGKIGSVRLSIRKSK